MTRLLALPAVALAAALTLSTSVTAQERGFIEPRDITTAIIPRQDNPRADRDFDGNGPIMVLAVRLIPARGGRAVFAEVLFSAREDGGDGSSASIQTRPFEVWRWQPSDGARFVSQIAGEPVVTVRLQASRGCAPIGCAIIGPSEDGGIIRTMTDLPGFLRDVTYLSDTTGDDISTDNDPHGDTSIRRIRFDPVEVIFSDRLGG